MSADIVLTAGVRANLLQLQKTSDLITATQTRLATGKRVNTALDNPVNFFTAAGLQVARNYQNYPAFPGSSPETRQAAIDSMNTGYDHVIHVGHGFRFNMSVADASVVNADADALTNGVKLMNLNLLNCTSSAFTYECIAEHFLRNPNGGAVSVVGSNDSAFPTVATEYM